MARAMMTCVAIAALAMGCRTGTGAGSMGLHDGIESPPELEARLLTDSAAGEYTVSGTVDEFDEEMGFGEQVLDQGVVALAIAIPDVCALQINSTRYRTKEGLGVGSSWSEWTRAYGALTLNPDTGLYEAEGVGLSVVFGADEPEPTDTIVSIRVGQCPI